MTDDAPPFRGLTALLGVSGSALGWFSSAQVGVITAAMLGLGMTLGAIYSNLSERRLKVEKDRAEQQVKAYREMELARIAVEKERDDLLRDSLSRKLETIGGNLSEALAEVKAAKEEAKAIKEEAKATKEENRRLTADLIALTTKATERIVRHTDANLANIQDLREELAKREAEVAAGGSPSHS